MRLPACLMVYRMPAVCMEFADGYFRKAVAEIFIDDILVRQVETTKFILYCKYGKQRAHNRDIFHRTVLCKIVVSAK